MFSVLFDWMNYKIIDTTSPVMMEYNYIYQPFNIIEAVIWFICGIRTAVIYRKLSDKKLVFMQVLAFMLFGISDLIEVHATTPILLLFKLSIIIALLFGRIHLRRLTI